MNIFTYIHRGRGNRNIVVGMTERGRKRCLVICFVRCSNFALQQQSFHRCDTADTHPL